MSDYISTCLPSLYMTWWRISCFHPSIQNALSYILCTPSLWSTIFGVVRASIHNKECLTVHHTEYGSFGCALFCCGHIIIACWIQMNYLYLPISFKITTLALGQSYDCPSASEVTLKDLVNIGWYLITTKAWQNTDGKHNSQDVLLWLIWF